jgi:hypothetical protein
MVIRSKTGIVRMILKLPLQLEYELYTFAFLHKKKIIRSSITYYNIVSNIYNKMRVCSGCNPWTEDGILITVSLKFYHAIIYLIISQNLSKIRPCILKLLSSSKASPPGRDDTSTANNRVTWQTFLANRANPFKDCGPYLRALTSVPRFHVHADICMFAP